MALPDMMPGSGPSPAPAPAPATVETINVAPGTGKGGRRKNVGNGDEADRKKKAEK